MNRLLYALREADFHKICLLNNEDVRIPVVEYGSKCHQQEKHCRCDPDLTSGSFPDACPDLKDDPDFPLKFQADSGSEGRNRGANLLLRLLIPRFLSISIQIEYR